MLSLLNVDVVIGSRTIASKVKAGSYPSLLLDKDGQWATTEDGVTHCPPDQFKNVEGLDVLVSYVAFKKMRGEGWNNVCMLDPKSNVLFTEGDAPHPSLIGKVKSVGSVKFDD